MSNIQFVADIVEENGLTVKQNNLKMAHTIPIGSIVEIQGDDSYLDEEDQNSGLRLFVVNHCRDCDGTPLYNLSFNKKAQEKIIEAERELIKANNNGDYFSAGIIKKLLPQYKGAITGGYDEDSLKLIK